MTGPTTIIDRHASLLSAYVSPEVVRHILSDGHYPLASGVRVAAVILFADLSGFTRLAARLPAERVATMLDEFFDATAGAVRGSGAVIDKLIGDAVMVVFGAPAPRPDDAARALRVAAQMHAAFAALAARWREADAAARGLGLAIGCAAGDVVLANVGSAARMDYTVIGTAVNLAARLVAAAPRGATLIDLAVRSRADAAAHEFRFGPERRLRLKGIPGLVRAYTVRPRRVAMSAAAAPSLVDPVCGMKLARPTRFHAAGGAARVYFCSRRCRDRWKAAVTPAGG